MEKRSRRKCYRLLMTFLLIAAFILQTADAVAQTKGIFLGDYRGIGLYRYHKDERNHCFMVRDLVLEEEELDELLSALAPADELLTRMQFELRQEDTYVLKGNQGVTVDYSSLGTDTDQAACPIIFSYDDGGGVMSITAYVYVFAGEETEPPVEDTETPGTEEETKAVQTETQETEETQVPTEAKPRETESEDQIEIRETQRREEIIIISPPGEATETVETESAEEVTDTSNENTEDEEDTSSSAARQNETVIYQEGKAAEGENEAEKLIMKNQQSLLYFVTFGSSGIITILFYISIYRDVAVMIDHQRRIYRRQQEFCDDRYGDG